MFFSASKQKNNFGFTLIELLVVISIISLLSSVVLSSLSSARMKARDVRRIQDLAQIRNAIELYLNDNNGTTPGWSTFFSQILSTDYPQISQALVPKYISSIPKDPIDPGTPITYGLDGYWYYYGRGYTIVNNEMTYSGLSADTRYIICSKMEVNKKNYTSPWAGNTLDYCIGNN